MLLFKTLKKLWALLTLKDRYYLCVLSLLLVFTGLLEMGGLALLFAYITGVSGQGDAGRIEIILDAFGWIAGASHESESLRFALMGGLFLVLFFAVKNVMAIVTDYLYRQFLFTRQKTVVSRLLALVLNAPYAQIKALPHHHIQKRFDSVGEAFQRSFVPAVRALTVLTLIGMIFVVLAVLNASLTLLLVTLFSAAAFVINRYNVSLHSMLVDQRKKTSPVISETVKEISQGFLAIRISQAQDYFSRNFMRALDKSMQTKLAQGTVWQIPYALNEVLLSMALVITIIFFLVSGQNLESLMPILAVFAFAGMRLARLFSRVSQSYQAMTQGKESIDEIMDVVAWDGAAPAVAAVAEPPAFTRAITAEAVGYRYPETAEAVLHDVSLDIPKGSFVGICGASGSGKSTLLLLLAGLLRPQSGHVYFDGKEAVPSIGFVPSTAYISPRTVRENVAFGCPRSAVDDKKVWGALQRAHLNVFVKERRGQLGGRLRAMGGELSDGQKQRLCLARVLYRDPDIIFLDEATALLDKKTEKKIMDDMRALGKDKTIICVSHHISALQKADVIHVLKAGRIVASDTYDALVKREEFKDLF